MIEPLNIVLFGIVGSGKGTQAKLLRDHIKAEYIGTGEIFRQIIESPDDGSGIQKIAKDILGAGKLMPDEITNQIVSEALGKVPDLNVKNLIFDGYPRTIGQSEYFIELARKHGRENVKVVFIELSEAEAMRRNLLRGRHDDTEEGLKQRFAEYKNNVLPAMEYFRGKPGFSVYTINGDQSVEEVQEEIIDKLGL